MDPQHLEKVSSNYREYGQTMAEYALIISMITVTIVVAIVAIGDKAGSVVQRVADYF